MLFFFFSESLPRISKQSDILIAMNEKNIYIYKILLRSITSHVIPIFRRITCVFKKQTKKKKTHSHISISTLSPLSIYVTYITSTSIVPTPSLTFSRTVPPDPGSHNQTTGDRRDGSRDFGKTTDFLNPTRRWPARLFALIPLPLPSPTPPRFPLDRMDRRFRG